jgi:cobalamin biosynthesis Mg chelatase CobN
MDGETDEFAALKNFWCVNLANSDLTHVYSVSPRAAVATPCPQALAEVESNVVPDFPPRGLNMSGIASHTSHRSSSTSSASSIHHTSKAAATAKKTSSSHHNHASTTAAAATAAAATSAAGKKSTKTVTHTEKHRHAHTTTRGHRSTGTPAPNMSVRYDAGLGFVGVALSTVAALFVMMF